MALHHPHTLLEIDRAQVTLEKMFDGLAAHYMHAAASGRLKTWEKAAHAIIDLMANDVPTLQRGEHRDTGVEYSAGTQENVERR